MEGSRRHAAISDSQAHDGLQILHDRRLRVGVSQPVNHTRKPNAAPVLTSVAFLDLCPLNPSLDS